MRKDYHIHPGVIQTPERFHAFVEQALSRGIREICVTDHMPLSISGAKDRIPQGMVGAYCNRVRALAREYQDRITIKCGIEIDYHPQFVGEIEAVLAEGTFDYILGSSHMHLFVKDVSRYTKNDFARIALENTLMAVESGYFHAVAHFDMYRFAFTKPTRYPFLPSEYTCEVHIGLIDDILRAIAERKMLLEINPHLAEVSGDFTNMYPQLPVVQMALAQGVRFVYGSDAHEPSSVGSKLDILEGHPIYGRALRSGEDVK